MRVDLPDVPGSLGRLATAIGHAGGDIEAIEIVEKNPNGRALDDVLLDTAPGTMPDSLVSACHALDGVEVVWISHYPTGGGVVLDLEAVEELTQVGAEALDKLVDLIPVTFRTDWAVRLHRSEGMVYGTSAAPDEFEFPDIERATRLDLPDDDVNLYAAARIDGNQVIVTGRRGGPVFIDSEIARLGHLCALAATIAHS